MSETHDCLNTLINDVVRDAQNYGISYAEAYFNRVNDLLTDNGDTRDLVFAEFDSGDFDVRNRARADGYNFEFGDEEGGRRANNESLEEMTIVVADYGYDIESGEITELKTLNTGDLEKKFLEMKRFIQRCSTPAFLNSIEPSSPYYGLVANLTKNFSKILKVKLIYATTSRFTGRIKEFKAEDVHGIQINKQLLDIERFCSVLSSTDGSEPTQIDFEEYGFGPLTALKTSGGSNTESMLLAVPGDLLFRIYEDHGARLLEQNVRTYLQARGNVNKGMIATLRDKPEMFFSYNNGLTATASEIEVSQETDSTKSIKSIKNLQIVNGGQTTASVHYSKFKFDADLSRVFVQVKLSVVDPELLETIVPKIAEYANTQNKVNAADFFANHPFHRQFESLSRQFATPRQANTLSNAGTHWFYERARGAYNNETYKLKTKREKDTFLSRYPKHQLILKTDLAKYLMSFEGHPDIVSKGAQAAFVQHANKIGLPEDFKKKQNRFDEEFFKESIAKTIIFRELDKIISKADWYEGGGSKACTIAYSIAWFAMELKSRNQLLDFEKVWTRQTMPAELSKILEDLAPQIYQKLSDTTPEHLSAVPQWAKQKRCWDGIKGQELFIDQELLNSVLTTAELKKEGKKSAKKAQRQYNAEKHWVAMAKLENTAWQAIKSFCMKHGLVKGFKPNQLRDLDRLASATSGQLKGSRMITEKEAQNLLPIFDEISSLDFSFHEHGVDESLR